MQCGCELLIHLGKLLRTVDEITLAINIEDTLFHHFFSSLVFEKANFDKVLAATFQR